MKNLIAIFIFLQSFNIFADTEIQKFNTKISAVTVFKKGAMVERSGTIKLIKGHNEIKFIGFPNTMNISSMILNAKKHRESIEIIDFYVMNAEKDEVKNEVEIVISKEISILENKKLQILRKINSIKSNTTFNNELKNSFLEGIVNTKKPILFSNIKLYRDRYFSTLDNNEKILKELNNELVQLGKKSLELTRKLNANSKTQNDIVNKKELFALINSDKNQSLEFSIKYYMKESRWSTYYNIYFSSNGNDAYMEYMANVSQDTGEDWHNVKISISEQNPKIKKDVVVKKNIDKNVYKTGNGTGRIKGIIIDENGYYLAGVNIVIEKMSSKRQYNELLAQTDESGHYYFIGINSGEYKIKCEYVGYKPEIKNVNVRVGLTKKINFKLHSKNVLEEKSKQKKEFKMGITQFDYCKVSPPPPPPSPPRQQESSVSFFASSYQSSRVKYSNYSSIYNPPGNYSLKSGKNVKLNIIKKDLKSKSKYYAIPNISNKLFLSKNIVNKTGLVFYPGQLNIYLNESYIGNKFISTVYQGDSINVDFGESRRVKMNRKVTEKIGEGSGLFNSEKFTKIKIETEFSNNNDAPRNIILKDPLPISAYKGIKVELIDPDTLWTRDDLKGVVKRKFKLKKGEKKKVNLEYKITYPDELKDITF